MHDLIIVGAGPAGLGAALQALHHGLDVLVLEKGEIGGRLRYAGEIRNFPGFMAARPSGAALVKKLRAQAQCMGVRIVGADCSLIIWRRSCFVARDANGDHRGRSVIIATGVRPVRLRIQGADRSADRIHYYWSDIPAIRGKTVAVIGAGEVAFDQACSLAKRGANIFVLARGNSPRAFPGLVALARRQGVIVRCNAPVRSIVAASNGGVVLRTPRHRVQADHILAATGSEQCLPPMTDSARNRMNLDFYLAGDVNEINSRQAVIAFSDGVQKAMRISTMLQRREHAECTQ